MVRDSTTSTYFFNDKTGISLKLNKTSLKLNHFPANFNETCPTFLVAKNPLTLGAGKNDWTESPYYSHNYSCNRDVFRNLPNIGDGVLCERSLPFQAINYFRKTHHLKCLKEFWICLYTITLTVTNLIFRYYCYYCLVTELLQQPQSGLAITLTGWMP